MNEEQNPLVKYDLIINQSDPFAIEPGLTVLFALKNHCTINTPGCSDVIRAGDMKVISPMKVFSFQCRNHAAILKVQFNQSVLRLADIASDRTLNCIIRASDPGEDLIRCRQLLAVLIRKCVNHEGKTEVRTSALEFVLRLYERFGEKTENAQFCSIRNMNLVAAVLEDIKNNWKKPVQVTQAAANQFVSVSYLSRCIRKYTGYSFRDCLTEVRLGHAVEDLRLTDKTITEIALDNGFSNANSLITVFKRKYKLTPSVWKRTFHQLDTSGGFSREKYEQEGIMEELLKYDTQIKPKQNTRVVKRNIRMKSGMAIRFAWKEILNAGYAGDLLYASVQKQISRAQHEIGFRYLRVKGILDDDLHVCRVNEEGKLVINFLFLDQITNYIVSEGLIPMLEFSWMPRDLAQKQFSFFNRCSIFSPPSDYELFEELIVSLVQHWTILYGEQMVSTWRFTFPMFNVINLFPEVLSYKTYLQMYISFYRAVKRVSKQYQIGGFGFYTDVLFHNDSGIRFLKELEARGMLPDFLTIQCFSHERLLADNDFYQYTMDQTSTPSVISEDVDYVFNYLNKIRQLLIREKLDHIPLIIEEWALTTWQRDLPGDTLFRASWLCRNLLQIDHCISGIGYWLITDLLSEWDEPRAFYHGGYGLLNQNGVAKAGYRLLQMLNRIGTELVSRGEGWFVSQYGDTLTILFYNYCHYEELYRLRYKKLEDPNQAYEAFQNIGNVKYELTINDFRSGNYQVTEEELTRMSGSSFDEWIRMGSPSVLTEAQTALLDQRSAPAVRQSIRAFDKTAKIISELAPHEVKMITLRYCGTTMGR